MAHLELLDGEAAEVVRAVGLKAAGDEGARRVAAGPGCERLFS